MARLVVDLHELGHFRYPAILHERGVIGMIAVKSVGGGISELHGQAKGELIFPTGLTQALKFPHAFDLGKLARSQKKIMFGGSA
jgi:hypothetical protein